MANLFVIMPFRPELGYFYRSLRQHVEAAFPNVKVERGDDRILTRPILDKIAGFIRKADVVVADCSGRNPNVFYELGLAHALERPVVLVTSDPVTEAPTDVRAFEFISYATLAPEQFFAKLDDALESVLGNPYADVHGEAAQLFQRFSQATSLPMAPVTEDQFVALAKAARAREQVLPANPGRFRAEYLLRRMLGVDPAIEVLIALKGWLDQEFPGGPNP